MTSTECARIVIAEDRAALPASVPDASSAHIRYIAPRDLDEVAVLLKAGGAYDVIFTQIDDLMAGLHSREIEPDLWNGPGITVRVVHPTEALDADTVRAVLASWNRTHTRRRREKVVAAVILSVIAVVAAFLLVASTTAR